MKLPKNIKGKNVLRDGAICLEWEVWHDSDLPKVEPACAFKTRLSEKYKLTERRIEQILRDNHAFIPIDREWEKKKRINWLRRQIAKKGDKTAKDSADLQEQLRKEVEGDKPLVDQSQHSHVTVIIGKHDNQAIRSSRITVGSV